MRTTLSLLLSLLLSMIATPREAGGGSDAPRSCGGRDLSESVSLSSVILVGEVADVKPPLGVWSGYFPVVQRVHYRVKAVLKGDISDKVVNVGHYVIANSLVADSKSARLSPEIFAKGHALILFLKADPGEGYIHLPDADRETNVRPFLSLDPCGALPADRDSVDMVRKAISSVKV
jgi:hypothetical protein